MDMIVSMHVTNSTLYHRDADSNQTKRMVDGQLNEAHIVGSESTLLLLMLLLLLALNEEAQQNHCV